MGWVTEKLTGTINGSNKAFTLTHAPVKESLLVYLPGQPLESMGSQPAGFAFFVMDDDIELGFAPQSEAERPSARYWWDDS